MLTAYRNREIAVDFAHPHRIGRVLVKLTPGLSTPSVNFERY